MRDIQHVLCITMYKMLQCNNLMHKISVIFVFYAISAQMIHSVIFEKYRSALPKVS